MKERCKKCGSNAFNLHWDGIEQADLCDKHYWQDKAENLPRSAIAQAIWEHGVYPERGLGELENEILKSFEPCWNCYSSCKCFTDRCVFCLIVAEALS